MLETVLGFALLLITGIFDGLAFDSVIHVWTQENLSFKNIVTSSLYTLFLFNVGIVIYIVANYFFAKVGFTNSLVVTLIWFLCTISVLSLVTGRFSELSAGDKVFVLLSIILVFILYKRGIGQ